MGNLGSCQSEGIEIKEWRIVPEASRLGRRLTGSVKIYFAVSLTILDLPVPELWMMGTKLSYTRRARFVFMISRAWTKSLWASPVYFASQAFSVTEQK